MFLVRADNAWSPSTPPESVSCHVDLCLEKAENRWRTGKRSDAAQRTDTPTSRQQFSENPVEKTSINRNASMQGIARVGADSPDCACRVGSPMVIVMDWFVGWSVLVANLPAKCTNSPGPPGQLIPQNVLWGRPLPHFPISCVSWECAIC